MYMELREQHYVLALGKHRSIKKAAEALHVTPPTLSVFLSTLEHQLGTKLFDRLGKTFVPTAAGALYLETAEKMVQLEEEYQARLGDLVKGITGKIEFGIHLRRTSWLLPPVLHQFMKEYPQVEVLAHELPSEPAYQGLFHGQLDFIIANTKKEQPILHYEPLYEDYLDVVLPAGHPACQKAKELSPGIFWLDLALLQDECFILQLPEQSSRIYTDTFLHQAGITPRRSIILSNLETASQMAAEGMGIAFNFEQYIRHFSYTKEVRYFRIGNCRSIPYSIVTRKDKYLPVYTKRLIQLFTDSVRQKKAREALSARS